MFFYYALMNFYASKIFLSLFFDLIDFKKLTKKKFKDLSSYFCDMCLSICPENDFDLINKNLPYLLILYRPYQDFIDL